MRSEFKQAEKILAEAVEWRKQYASESDDLADTINDLAWSLTWQYRLAEAVKNLEESLRIYRLTDSVQGKAKCIRHLGSIAWRKSDYKSARDRYEQALSLYREIGDVKGETDCIRLLGSIAFWGSDYTAASDLYEQALSIYRDIGFVYGEAQCIRRLGDIAFERSDHVTAKERYEQALSLFRKIGLVWGEAHCVRGLGDIVLRRSDQAEAWRYFETALKLFERTEEPLAIGSTHLRLARLAENASERNQHIQAARAIWKRIDRPDLIRELEEEFGAESRGENEESSRQSRRHENSGTDLAKEPN